jgi:hypothetical protein
MLSDLPSAVKKMRSASAAGAASAFSNSGDFASPPIHRPRTTSIGSAIGSASDHSRRHLSSAIVTFLPISLPPPRSSVRTGDFSTSG